MSDIIETVLLLALPASGKSEVRRYLDSVSEEDFQSKYHLGPTVQLDDYPYVHVMRVIDDTLAKNGVARRFFEAPDRGFANPIDWETLIELVNQDYTDLAASRARTPDAPAAWLLDRFDEARQAVGGDPALASLGKEPRALLEQALVAEADEMLADWNRQLPESLDGKTVVIEFARGGPEGSSFPLPAHHGYQASLARLSNPILERSTILYIWVTPEQSRAKNLERAKPDEDGSILFHGVPEHVMRNEYGCDDIGWLLEQSDKPGSIRVESRGRVFHLPAARFDNRTDLTTFLREDHASWPAAAVQSLSNGLEAAFEQLWKLWASNHK
jgi:hypothetical protein